MSNVPSLEISTHTAASRALVPGPFAALGLEPTLTRAVEKAGYTVPTPIQLQGIPPALEGRDVLGCAQTGTGKTAAFALPALQRLGSSAVREERASAKRAIRALVLSPTRELAAQIQRSFETYGRGGRLRSLVIFGGVGPAPQVAALSRGVDILVATPGRLADYLNQRIVDLSKVEILVLDEADRMLDEGFLPDVTRIIAKVGARRQTMMFSATMPEPIEALARRILVNPIRIAVAPVASTPDAVDQVILHVDTKDKRALLGHVLEDRAITRAIVFTRTKHGANRVAQHLEKAGVAALAIHGNKSQNARERALSMFREGSLRILVATDVAARGLDISGVSHIVNFDLPNDPESYVHRIGRTARAGAKGSALSFCSSDERSYLAGIERLIRRRIPVRSHPYALDVRAHAPAEPVRDGQYDRRGSASDRPSEPHRRSRGGSQRRR
ncbi:MAG: DEAD/DEAH box helicase [Deltaproteobacteria bacterium]|nr:DEAD/DEAH box helicase [Deltaproteobacteria bacterium]